MSSSTPVTRPAANMSAGVSKSIISVSDIVASNVSKEKSNNTEAVPAKMHSAKVDHSPLSSSAPCVTASSVWAEMQDDSPVLSNNHIRNAVLAYLESTNRHDVVRAILEADEQAGLFCNSAKAHEKLRSGLIDEGNSSFSVINEANKCKIVTHTSLEKRTSTPQKKSVENREQASQQTLLSNPLSSTCLQINNNNNNNNNTTKLNHEHETNCIAESKEVLEKTMFASPSPASPLCASQHYKGEPEKVDLPEHNEISLEENVKLHREPTPTIASEKRVQAHGKWQFSKPSYKWLVESLLRRHRCEHEQHSYGCRNQDHHYSNLENKLESSRANAQSHNSFNEFHEPQEEIEQLYSQTVQRTLEEKILPCLCASHRALECDLRLLYSNAKTQLMEQYHELGAPLPQSDLWDAVIEQQVCIPMWSGIDEHVIMSFPNPVDVQTNDIVHGTLNQLVEELTFVHITPATYNDHFALVSSSTYGSPSNHGNASSWEHPILFTGNGVKETFTQPLPPSASPEQQEEELSSKMMTRAITAKSDTAYKFAVAFLRQHRRITSSSVLLAKLIERFSVPLSLKLGFNHFMAHGISIDLPNLCLRTSSSSSSSPSLRGKEISNVVQPASCKEWMCERAHSETITIQSMQLHPHMNRGETLSSFNSQLEEPLAHVQAAPQSVSSYFPSHVNANVISAGGAVAPSSSLNLPPQYNFESIKRYAVKHYSPSATLWLIVTRQVQTKVLTVLLLWLQRHPEHFDDKMLQCVAHFVEHTCFRPAVWSDGAVPFAQIGELLRENITKAFREYRYRYREQQCRYRVSDLERHHGLHTSHNINTNTNTNGHGNMYNNGDNMPQHAFLQSSHPQVSLSESYRMQSDEEQDYFYPLSATAMNCKRRVLETAVPPPLRFLRHSGSKWVTALSGVLSNTDLPEFALYDENALSSLFTHKSLYNNLNTNTTTNNNNRSSNVYISSFANANHSPYAYHHARNSAPCSSLHEMCLPHEIDVRPEILRSHAERAMGEFFSFDAEMYVKGLTAAHQRLFSAFPAEDVLVLAQRHTSGYVESTHFRRSGIGIFMRTSVYLTQWAVSLLLWAAYLDGHVLELSNTSITTNLTNMSFNSSTQAANKKKRRLKRMKRQKNNNNTSNTKVEYTNTKEHKESFAGENKHTTTDNANEILEKQDNNADNNGKVNKSECNDGDIDNNDNEATDNEGNDDEDDDDLLDEDDDDDDDDDDDNDDDDDDDEDMIDGNNILALVTKSSKNKNNDNDDNNDYNNYKSKVCNASFRTTRVNTIQGNSDGAPLQSESQHPQLFTQTHQPLGSNTITRTESMNYNNKHDTDQTDNNNSKANAEWRNILDKQTVGCLFFHVTSRLLDLVVGFLKVNNIHASFSVFRAFEHPFVNTILHHPRIVRHTSAKTKHQLRHLKVFFATKERNAEWNNGQNNKNDQYTKQSYIKLDKNNIRNANGNSKNKNKNTSVQVNKNTFREFLYTVPDNAEYPTIPLLQHYLGEIELLDRIEPTFLTHCLPASVTIPHLHEFANNKESILTEQNVSLPSMSPALYVVHWRKFFIMDEIIQRIYAFQKACVHYISSSSTVIRTIYRDKAIEETYKQQLVIVRVSELRILRVLADKLLTSL